MCSKSVKFALSVANCIAFTWYKDITRLFTEIQKFQNFPGEDSQTPLFIFLLDGEEGVKTFP